MSEHAGLKHVRQDGVGVRERGGQRSEGRRERARTEDRLQIIGQMTDGLVQSATLGITYFLEVGTRVSKLQASIFYTVGIFRICLLLVWHCSRYCYCYPMDSYDDDDDATVFMMTILVC